MVWGRMNEWWPSSTVPYSVTRADKYDDDDDYDENDDDDDDGGGGGGGGVLLLLLLMMMMMMRRRRRRRRRIRLSTWHKNNWDIGIHLTLDRHYTWQALYMSDAFRQVCIMVIFRGFAVETSYQPIQMFIVVSFPFCHQFISGTPAESFWLICNNVISGATDFSEM